MLRPLARFHQPIPTLYRWFNSHIPKYDALKQRLLPQDKSSMSSTHQPRRIKEGETLLNNLEDLQVNAQRNVKRNELGVQLLSRKLHSQIFRNVSFPKPDSAYVQIAREHLEMHGLDPTQGSVLQDTGFQLPPLQGSNISEHFHRIGSRAAEPWLALAKCFATVDLPTKPDNWDIQSGWTRYYFHPDGSSYQEHVDYPIHDGKPEKMLTFDVETMPPYHPYPIMACAASQNAWYVWISPWLLGESEDPEYLIPLGDPDTSRIIIGHNVSYDRGRIREEYNLDSTNNRFIDTMALHVAVKGISSHQRPAWMRYRKSRDTEVEQHQEAIEAVIGLMRAVDERLESEVNTLKKDELRQLRKEMADSLTILQGSGEEISNSDVVEAEITSKRWEELTSANSLVDVAKLHCGIHMDKEVRNDFMSLGVAEIRANISDYLDYCSNDVYVTHRVFVSVFPAFLRSCPHPVSFAGVLTMGSSFLTVNEQWEQYLKNAENAYRKMEKSVQEKLKKLAEDAKSLADEEKWKDDPWLGQLDWAPKKAGPSRGIFPSKTDNNSEPSSKLDSASELLPSWYQEILVDPFGKKSMERILPLILKLSYDGYPLQFSPQEHWHFVRNGEICRMGSARGRKVTKILGKTHGLPALKDGRMLSCDDEIVQNLCLGSRDNRVRDRLLQLSRILLDTADSNTKEVDPWLKQLDWENIQIVAPKLPTTAKKRLKGNKAKCYKPPPVLWPKWYWDATKPKKGLPPGTLDITVRNRISPILLRLSWLGWPLFYSHEYGWTFRVPASATFSTHYNPLTFYDPADNSLAEASLHGGYTFYKLPHKDGESANVGSPLAKTFMKYAQDDTLKSPGDEAKEALDMNAKCSYWISARDRILNQMVIWQNDKQNLGFKGSTKGSKWGIILPQVITMGTVTRRAIERTWLTASNAKSNRVGSELKAMVRAPEGYAIVGADVDSEELWISSCMGDAQFGLHGATAIGWMTLEGTKAAGTDLHSKTANILGISRDQAKVFNYSRIYGAGMRHAILLLQQSNAGMLPGQAHKLAENLYISTKGKNTNRTDIFERKFWFGGTESYLFNKLEEIALSDKPQTPALGCGVTHALSKDHLPVGFGTDYMPSRINWVVQSSGVDYLHLLIVAMDHLIAKYDIKARYLISVHDELRYLVVEEDKYRAALALQIANLWTRSMFAYKLGMDDLPQGVAFFSAVDVDKVLRKEVYMPCVTPSQPIPIPPGESLDIIGILEKTNGGSLWKDGHPMDGGDNECYEGSLEGYIQPDCLTHRAPNAAFLKAQATTDFGEVKGLAQQVYGKKFTGTACSVQRRKKRTPLGNGVDFDWSDTVEKLLAS